MKELEYFTNIARSWFTLHYSKYSSSLQQQTQSSSYLISKETHLYRLRRDTICKH